jgi:hypothetical protein
VAVAQKMAGGTTSSNPASSSGESTANPTFGGAFASEVQRFFPVAKDAPVAAFADLHHAIPFSSCCRLTTPGADRQFSSAGSGRSTIPTLYSPPVFTEARS